MNECRTALERDAQASGIDLRLVNRAPIHEWQLTRLFEVLIEGRFEAGLEITFDCRDDFLIELAEFVQATIHERVGSWPACPAHGDPMEPVVNTDDVFTWICERDSTITFPVGAFPGPGFKHSEVSDDDRYNVYWHGKESE